MDTTFAPWEKPKVTLAPWEKPKAQTTSTFAPVAESIDPDTLASNSDWMAASRNMYKYDNGEYFTGTDQELAAYSLDALGQFNYNLIQMGVDAAQITNAPDDYKQSFLYLMDSYDALEMSWGGAGRVAVGMATDPTTYSGLLTLGWGTAASVGTKVTTKAGIKELLKAGLRTGVQVGIEGAASSAASSVARQQVEVAGGRRDEISTGQVVKDAAIGAGAGLVLGTGAGAFTKKLDVAKAAKEAAKATPTPSATQVLPNGQMAPQVAPMAPAAVPGPTVPPVAQVVPPVAAVEPVLPGSLAGAKPRYNYGQKGFGLQFESDVERALFITSQTKKSKSDDAYRGWLRSTGYTDAEIDTLGKQVRDAIKLQAKDSTDEVLTIGKLTERKPVVQSAPIDPTVKPNVTRPEMVTQNAPGTTKVEDVIAAIKEAAPDLTVGNIPRSKAELAKLVNTSFNTLRNLGVTSAQDAMDLIPRLALSQDQQTAMKVAVQDSAENISRTMSEFLKVKNASTSSADEVAQATAALADIEPLQKLLSQLDQSISSPSGRDLGSRVGGLLVNERRGLSVDSIITELKLDPSNAADRVVAEVEFASRVDKFIAQVAQDKEIVALTKQVQEAFNAGNMTNALKALSERDALLTRKVAAQAKNSTALGRVYEAINKSFIGKLNEYIISTVFDFATLAVNVIPAITKTVYKPALNMVVKGAGSAARKEMMHTYGAMMSKSGAAFSASKAAFKYEKSLLTGGIDKMLENGPSIQGRKGEWLRFFPRALNATDEFFARINYQGFVAGEAAHDAMEQGMRKGLKGDALDAFVNDAVTKATTNSVELGTDAVKVLEVLRQRGMNRGLKGQKLEFWIKAEMDKNAEFFKQATNQSGRDYVDDLLFKREFSGDNAASSMAKGYERFVNKNPIMRLAGQLFFRTPVRVFQEGIRLTPGFQLFDPTFFPDLIGTNGTAKQVRAQGEVMMSYGIAAYAIAMYSTGNITGGGPSNYRQRRAMEDGKNFEPYSIQLGDGSTFSFRNLDPFATPMKIMVNLMDRMAELEYRKSQGENIDGLMGETFQYISVGFGALTQAVRDASLTTGFDQLLMAWDALTQEDDTTKIKELEKLIGKKTQLLVPALVSGTQGIMDTRMRDPATIEQYFMTRLNPNGAAVPMMYDALGRPRTVSNPYSSVIAPIPTTKGMREGNITEKEQIVLNGLADLQIANDATFVFPYKMPGFDFDMRKRMTQDGKETLYDRVMATYRGLHPEDALYPLFANEGVGTVGTGKVDGTRIQTVRSIMNSYREAAFAIVLGKEAGLTQEMVQNILRKATVEMGGFATQPNPYRQ